MDNLRIRQIEPKDIEQLNIIRTTAGIFECLLSLPSEPQEVTRQYFLDNPERKHTLIAETIIDEKVKAIGYVCIRIDPNLRKRHKGQLSLAVSSEYQAKGVAGELIEKIIDLSSNWLMLQKIELMVLVENKRAIKLYEKYGFEIEGHLKQDTIVNGTFQDVYYMSRIKGEHDEIHKIT